MSFHVRQEHRYSYTAPVTDLRQRLIMIPATHYDDQHLLSHELTVDGADSVTMEWETDRFGNRFCRVRAARVADSVAFAVDFEVERSAPVTLHRLRANATSDQYLPATALTASDARIDAAAAQLNAELARAPLAAGLESLDEQGRRRWTLARLAGEWAAGVISYHRGMTGVQTPAAMALHFGGGVCQDYAHIAIAVLRVLGVPARYVSGHVLGEGAPHAWFEAILPDPAEPARLCAWAYDPTHKRSPGLSYITVAVGRDYADIAPTSGSFTGPANSRLASSKDAWVVDVQPVLA